MHGEFIASIKILNALFNSSTVEEFLYQRLPDICASPRAYGVKEKLEIFANEAVQVYTRNGIPDSNGYKRLIAEASSLDCTASLANISNFSFTPYALGDAHISSSRWYKNSSTVELLNV